ncbi:hypothetical protein [Embleya hyalina]|uniref:hypothetical protein n=1 Tax=Embleya hyalina TaxID=516124 RepID=UPI001FE87D57|nr:hypothetical protein [Embleya hyalina]
MRPILRDVSDVDDGLIGLLLLGYGLAGVVGNFAAGGPSLPRRPPHPASPSPPL